MLFLILSILVTVISDCASIGGPIGFLITSSGKSFVLDGTSVRELSYGQMLEQEKFARPEVFALSSNERVLIVCWSHNSTDSSNFCTMYDTFNLNKIAGRVDIRRAPTSNFFISTEYSGDRESLFVMATNSGVMYHGEFYISTGSKRRQEQAQVEHTGRFERRYRTSFTFGNFTYFLASDKKGTDHKIVIVRVCNEGSTWNSWYEIVLYCGPLSNSENLDDFDNDFIAATLLNPENEKEPRVILMTSNSRQMNINVCSFPLSDIDGAATASFGACRSCSSKSLAVPVWDNRGFPNRRRCENSTFTQYHLSPCKLSGISPFNRYEVGPKRLATSYSDPPEPCLAMPLHQETPLLTLSMISVTASIAVRIDSAVVVLVGTQQEVRKYTVCNFSTPLNSTIPENIWTLGEPVKIFSHSIWNNSVYAITENSHIYHFPIEECSNFTDCASCITKGGKLCGWCSLESKCSRRSKCANNNYLLRWVQLQLQCISVELVLDSASGSDAYIFPADAKQIIFNIENLPPLFHQEIYECRFGSYGSFNLTQISNNSYACDLPNMTLQGTVQQSYSIGFQLLYVNLSENFGLIETKLTLFDCISLQSCSLCVQHSSCVWCSTDHQCTYTKSKCSKRFLIKVPKDCPQLFPNPLSTLGYPVHSGMVSSSRTLNLTVRNLVNYNLSNITYECQLSVESNTVKLRAVVLDATSLMCLITSPFELLTPNRTKVIGTVRVLWTNGIDEFPIDQPEGSVPIVIYDCLKIGLQGCSACFAQEDILQCSYCTTTNTCVYGIVASSMCRHSNSLSYCGLPNVTSISPLSGPVKGGTALTITGQNLGFFPKENVSILIGGQLCPIVSDKIIPGVQLVCVIPPSMDREPTSVAITLEISFQLSVGNYMYKEPVISKIFPNRGPSAGGTNILIFGSNLDIGNIENTTVSIDGHVCIRIEIQSSSILCTTTSTDKSYVTAGIQLTIDGNNFLGPSSVLYTYVKPIFKSLFDKSNFNDGSIISRGGVTIFINGDNMNAAIQPQLSLKVDNMTYITNCSVVTHMRLLCVAPVFKGVVAGTAFKYSLIFDNEELTDLQNVQTLVAVVNPVFDKNITIEYNENSGEFIQLQGRNLNNVLKTDISITIASQYCSSMSVTDTMVVCKPPQFSPNGQSTAPILVHIGSGEGILVEEIGTIRYKSNFITILMSSLASITLTVIVVVIVLIVVYLLCHYKKKSKKLKCRHIREMEQFELQKEVLNQQVENVLSQMQVLQSQLHETVQDEKQTKAASNYENPYDVLDFEDQLPKMCIEKCNSHVSDSFQSQYDLERYVEMTGRKASDSNWDFDDPKVSALSGL